MGQKKSMVDKNSVCADVAFLSTAHAEASEIEEEQALKEAKEAVEEALFGEFGFEEVTGALESMFRKGRWIFPRW